MPNGPWQRKSMKYYQYVGTQGLEASSHFSSHICLQFPHSVQQLMSGEATPVLIGVLPAFQRLQNCWESHAAMHHNICCYMYEGMVWLKKYHEKAGRSPTYVIAMGVLPVHIAAPKSCLTPLLI
jgi:hypothetical protein